MAMELIVVDDASTDRTAEVAARYPGIHLLRHERNQGKGAAATSSFSTPFAVAGTSCAMHTKVTNETLIAIRHSLLFTTFSSQCAMLPGLRRADIGVGSKQNMPR